MDRVITKKNKKTKTYSIVATVIFLVFGVIFLIRYDWNAKVVEKEKVRIASVRRADLVVDVAGSGRIMPSGVEWVVAKMPGVVYKVHVEAGDTVKEGQLLLELTNPESDVQLQQTEARLLEAKAALSSKEFELASQEMQYRSAVVQAEFSYEADKVVFEAYDDLMKKPNSPIPKLEFMKAKVAAQKQQRLYEVAQGQFKNFKQYKVAQLEEFKSKVSLAEHEHTEYLNRVNQLKLVATKSGVIQDFDLKVGQPITGGESVGKIVDPKNLFVRLELPAIEAYKIAKDQPAKIQISREIVDGIVTRLDPNIKGTTIEVDVKLVGEIKSAKVDMFVNGRVIVSEIKNALVVNRPSSAVENGVSKIYKLDKDESFAYLVSVNTGSLSSNEMQIINGLTQGDRILVSELNNLKGVESIRIR